MPIEERWCSLELQGTRRCPREISDAKHTSKMWENIHRRWVMPWRLRFLQKKLEISFYSITMHQVMFIIISMSTPYSLHFLLQRPLIITLRTWLSLSNALSTERTLKAYWWPLENSSSSTGNPSSFHVTKTQWQVLNCLRTPERNQVIT